MVSLTHYFKSAPQWLGQGEGLKGGAGHVEARGRDRGRGMDGVWHEVHKQPPHLEKS